jgi:hypothetical protein
MRAVMPVFLLSRNMMKSQRLNALIVTAITYIKKLPGFLLKQTRNHKKDYYAGMECGNYCFRTCFSKGMSNSW